MQWGEGARGGPYPPIHAHTLPEPPDEPDTRGADPQTGKGGPGPAGSQVPTPPPPRLPRANLSLSPSRRSLEKLAYAQFSRNLSPPQRWQAPPEGELRDADTSLPVITPWLPRWELEVGEEAQSSQQWQRGTQRWAGAAPTSPQPYCTSAETETQRRHQKVHSDPAGLLPGVCLLTWMPESPRPGVHPGSTIHLLCGLSFPGWKMERSTAPCSLHRGGHTWSTQVAEELLLGPRGPCQLPSQPLDPKAQSSWCTLPRRAGKRAMTTWQGLGTLGCELGPSSAGLPTL